MFTLPAVRPFVLLCLALAGSAAAAPLDGFIERAKQGHGESGERAARFLIEHMPAGDRSSLTAEYLLENLEFAFRARAEFPWAAQVPEELFFNDVLPYAVLDEARHPWRADFLARARPLVKEAKTASEAAQALNREFFKLVSVHYNTRRKHTSQSPKESMESGMATCTGLSVILVDACRAVGIAARVVGTPMWANNRGNHTWVEIWDGTWHFTGADEFNAKGLDQAWFVKDASGATSPEHGIYASSWQKSVAFPMAWAPENGTVGAVDVTARYAAADADHSATARLGVRLFDAKAGQRIAASLKAFNLAGDLLGATETTQGRADLNDIARLNLKPGSRGVLRFTRNGITGDLPFGPLEAGDSTIDAFWKDLAPSASAAESPSGGAASSKRRACCLSLGWLSLWAMR